MHVKLVAFNNSEHLDIVVRKIDLHQGHVLIVL